jgi:hypothetical protein
MADAIMTIETVGNEVSLSLSNVAITMRLSEATLAQAHQEIEDDPDVSAGGWAGNLARFVTGSVEKLLRSSIEYPLADITAISDDNGTITFHYRSQRILTFEDVMIGVPGKRKQALSSFSPTDAQAFVARARELMAR